MRIQIIIFIIIGAVILSLDMAKSSQLDNQDWHAYAKEYIAFDKKVFDAQAEEKMIKQTVTRDKFKDKFISSSPPSRVDIANLLSSSNVDDIDIGVVSISLLDTFNSDFVGKLTDLLISSSDYYNKRFLIRALDKAEPNDFINHEDKILNHIAKEEDDRIVMEESRILLKLTPDKSAKVLTGFLTRDSRAIKRFAVVRLNQLGENYLNEAFDQLHDSYNIDKDTYLEDLKRNN